MTINIKELHDIATKVSEQDIAENKVVYDTFKESILDEIDEMAYRYAQQGFFNLKLETDTLYYDLGLKPEHLPLLRKDLMEEGYRVTIRNNVVELGW